MFNNFIYPSEDEVQYFNDLFPKLKKFNFETNLLSSNLEKIERSEKLFAWDNAALTTKINHLNYSFLCSLVFHRRGLSRTINNLDYNTKKFVYYLEYAFLNMQSIVDIHYQLINVFYNINEPINKVTFRLNDDKAVNSFSKKLFEIKPEVFELVKGYYNCISNKTSIRNAITHKYSGLIIDQQPIFDNSDSVDSIILNSFNKQLPDYERFLDELKSWIKITEEFQNNLKTFFEANQIEARR